VTRSGSRLNSAIARLGRGHADVELRAEDLAGDPIEQFAAWLEAALAEDLLLPNAMTLATATTEGRPSARIVLLKGFDASGFVFFTNYSSRKARELESNPHAALVFHWAELERQVRVCGMVARVAKAQSESYWATRPRATRLGAWASQQSSVIASRAELDDALRDASLRFQDDVPLPPQWGGYRLTPDEVEFWQGRRDRLHDRFLYRRAEGAWIIERLAP